MGGYRRDNAQQPQGEQQGPNPRKQREDDLIRFLMGKRGAFLTAMPEIYRERFDDETFALAVVQGVMTCVKSDKNLDNRSKSLLGCDFDSILTATIAALRAGLVPGGAQVWLIRYGSTATLQLGYQGMVELIARTGRYGDPRTDIVHKDDEWEYDAGLGTLRHVYGPGRADCDYKDIAKDFTYAYARIPRLDGGPDVIEVTTVRDALRWKQGSGAWRDSGREMVRKFVLKRAFKYMPKTPETIALIQADNAAEAAEAIEVTATEPSLSPLQVDRRRSNVLTLPAPAPDLEAEEWHRAAEGHAPEPVPAGQVDGETIDRLEQMLGADYGPGDFAKMRADAGMPTARIWTDGSLEAQGAYLRLLQDEAARLYPE